jgi:hypothetical protein
MCRISLVWEDHAGTPKTQAGLMEDRSLSGAGISVTEAIPVGTRVKFCVNGQELIGAVQYCRLNGFNYQVGVRLEKLNPDGPAPEPAASCEAN